MSNDTKWFYDWLEKKMKEHNVSAYKIASDIGLDKHNFYNMIKERKNITLSTMKKIMDYFDSSLNLF